MAVGADNDAVRVVSGGEPLRDLARRGIHDGKVIADRGLVILVTVMAALLSGAMIALVLLTAEQP